MSQTNTGFTNGDEKTSNGVKADKYKINGDVQNDKELSADDLRCGFGSCRPDWLQVFNNPKVFLLWLCYFSFVQGFVVNGINNVNTTAIERRFNLPSARVGLVSSAYDFSAAILALLISYIGAYGHQPRLLAMSAFVMALGSFVMTIPHWATGLYELGAEDAGTCRPDSEEECGETDSGLQNYLYVLIFGQALHGVGGQTLYSLGVVFIDANVRTQSSPLYQGIMLGFSVLGPAMGYLVGGLMLNIYTDFMDVNVDELSITTEDPRWVGAWWLGFLAGGCLALVIVIILLSYARMLPSSIKAQKDRVSECHQNEGADLAESKENFGKSIKDFPRALKLLFTNPVFMLLTLAGCTEGLATAGFATFLPKFIQNQFAKTPSNAAFLTGLVTVPGAAGGCLFGGLLCRGLKLKVRGMLRFGIIMIIIGACCTLFFLIKCAPIPFAGVSVEYLDQSNKEAEILDNVNTTSSCNSECGCTEESYTPICGIDGIQYFSACHAGCLNAYGDEGQYYENCSCITRPADAQDSEWSAEKGVCSLDCATVNALWPFIFLLIFATLTVTVPSMNTTLRCVPDNMRAFAVGLQWMFVRLLGTVPGPVVFGFAFDKSCIVWQDGCDGQGSCWIYDNNQISVNLLLLGFIIKIISLTFFSLALYFYKAPPDEDKASPNEDPGINKSNENLHNNSTSTQGLDNVAFKMDDSNNSNVVGKVTAL